MASRLYTPRARRIDSGMCYGCDKDKKVGLYYLMAQWRWVCNDCVADLLEMQELSDLVMPESPGEAAHRGRS